MINPQMISFIKMLRQSPNPQAVMMNLVSQRLGNTPMGQNLLNLMRNGQSNDIEQIVRNVMQAQGRDFDKEMEELKQMFASNNF